MQNKCAEALKFSSCHPTNHPHGLNWIAVSSHHLHHRYQECTTLTMPAFDPTNLTAYDEDLYTFEACFGTIFGVLGIGHSPAVHHASINKPKTVGS